MISIYQRALGTDFQRLHPQIQKRFGLTSQLQRASVSTGVMEEIWGGAFFMRPFLQLGIRKHLTFPERGKNIPFTLENYAYQDKAGRESVAWIRKFQFEKERHFDATMIYSRKRNGVIDYLGIDQDLITTIDISVLENGGIKIVSGPQFFYKKGLKIPVPMSMTGSAEAVEWYDDETDCFHINVEVNNRRFGTIFGYKGTFTTTYVAIRSDEIPAYAKPRREVYFESL